MFDPTVFENLKVALENQLYDLDNLDGIIRITNRTDRMEMSVMAREFALQFELIHGGEIKAEIRLMASLQDLAAEILEMKDQSPGCKLVIRFDMEVVPSQVGQGLSKPLQCDKIEKIMKQHWPDLTLVQTVSCMYGKEPVQCNITAELTFNRKINEDQMDDIPELIEHVVDTLRTLEECFK
ncbi:hypothetical protein [Paenibacillus pini]|uniref:Uncharacterized protein n=1 Tax=Paenibacillus pini JCM 16418 TaxID=1236976 RepID=W7YL73_9BACL|nr:hypothetical protein [Paenibacillus pini]GAF08508.1 hypothetical protein JCM16418_2589 [Paenibacillus pini JCM 16418]